MNHSDVFREQIRHLVRSLGILDKVSHIYGTVLTLPQCHALVEIGRCEGISLKELAHVLEIDVSTTSRTVDGLVKKGFAIRQQQELDRRSIHIRLTEEGKLLFDHTEAEMADYYDHVFSKIPEAKQEQVLDSLTLILDSFQQEKEEDNGRDQTC